MAQFSKFCFCLPLRTGLLIWGYFALVIIYISILRMLFTIQDIFSQFHGFDSAKLPELVISFGISLIHFLFYVVFVTALHKKSRGLLEFFYAYNVFIVIALIVIMSLYLPAKAYNLLHAIGVDALLFIVMCLLLLGCSILIQLYLIVAVRSLISKLEDEKDCSSAVYQTDDPECIIHMYKNYCDC